MTRKTYAVPRRYASSIFFPFCVLYTDMDYCFRPFEAARLDAELKLAGEYGLRNKREIWYAFFPFLVKHTF
jgi:hypothetical protein